MADLFARQYDYPVGPVVGQVIELAPHHLAIRVGDAADVRARLQPAAVKAGVKGVGRTGHELAAANGIARLIDRDNPLAGLVAPEQGERLPVGPDRTIGAHLLNRRAHQQHRLKMRLRLPSGSEQPGHARVRIGQGAHAQRRGGRAAQPLDITVVHDCQGFQPAGRVKHDQAAILVTSGERQIAPSLHAAGQRFGSDHFRCGAYRPHTAGGVTALLRLEAKLKIRMTLVAYRKIRVVARAVGGTPQHQLLVGELQGHHAFVCAQDLLHVGVAQDAHLAATLSAAARAWRAKGWRARMPPPRATA